MERTCSSGIRKETKEVDYLKTNIVEVQIDNRKLERQTYTNGKWLQDRPEAVQTNTAKASVTVGSCWGS